MGNSGSKGSSGGSSNSGGSNSSGNNSVCRGQDFFTTNDGERGICFYAPKSNSGNGGSGSYPSGTGSSGRDGRGGGGVKSGSDESKESGSEYSSYTSSVKYSTTGLRKLHNDYLQSKFSTFDVGYGQIHSNAIIGTNHFSQGVPFVNEVVTTIRGEVSKGTLHHKLAINASNRGLVDVDLYNLGTQLSGSSGTTTSGVTLNLCLFDLHQNNITHLGMNNFLHFFKWQNINEVNFSSNQLGDNSCRQLGQAFSAAWLPHLFNLNLSNNQIGDSGGQYLAQSLTGHFHNNLKYLNLANNNLTNNGITPFADGLSSGKITKLKTLHLEGNKLSPAGESYLAVAVNKAPNDTLGVIVEKHTSSAGVWNFIKKAFNYYAQEHYKKAQANDKAALAIYGQDDWAHCKKLVADASQEMSTGFVKYSSYMLAKQALQKGSLPVKTCAVGGVFIFSAGEAALNVNVENLVYCLIAINKKVENIIKPNDDVSYFSPELELIGNNGEVDDGF